MVVSPVGRVVGTPKGLVLLMDKATRETIGYFVGMALGIVSFLAWGL